MLRDGHKCTCASSKRSTAKWTSEEQPPRADTPPCTCCAGMSTKVMSATAPLACPVAHLITLATEAEGCGRERASGDASS